MRQVPKWVTIGPDGGFYIDPDLAYPAILKSMAESARRELQAIDPKADDAATKERIKRLEHVAKADTEADAYLLEIAYQCAKLKVQELFTDTEHDPRPNGGFIIHVVSGSGRKSRWANAKVSPGRAGRDMNAATKGLHAKQLYGRIASKLSA